MSGSPASSTNGPPGGTASTRRPRWKAGSCAAVSRSPSPGSMPSRFPKVHRCWRSAAVPAPPPWSWPAAATRSMHRTAVFDLVLALGVLSWLPEPNLAIKEMARVTRPGGHVLVTSLNSLDLARLLDPLRTPLFAPAKSAARLVAAGLGRLPQGRVRPTRHPSWSVQWRLRRSGLLPIRQTTVGFGPFTYL